MSSSEDQTIVRAPVNESIDEDHSLARINYAAGIELLPELHQAWWAQQLAQLMEDERRAEASGDSRQITQADEALRHHYALRHITNITAEKLAATLQTELQQERQARAKISG